MNPAVVRVSVEPVSLETGLWCIDCMRSSGCRASVATTVAGQLMRLHVKVRCRDCGGERVVDASSD